MISAALRKRCPVDPAASILHLHAASNGSALHVINTDKCEVICFTWKDYGPVFREVLPIQGDRLLQTTPTRYLGMVLTGWLWTKVAATRRIQTGRAAFMCLAPLLHRFLPPPSCSFTPRHTAIHHLRRPVWYNQPAATPKETAPIIPTQGFSFPIWNPLACSEHCHDALP
ncbi:hypothetical protein J6590_040515 [Homalodisca vitripennis]|nr:hypothetical protein J6590_094721 [Homalodisca vitripennis]KAG8277510.1 hypothetical protein J6590_040515 [Homalodisca vitripennis]